MGAPREKIDAVPPAWNRLHRVTAGTLIKSERRAVTRIGSAVDDATTRVAAHVGGLSGSPQAIKQRAILAAHRGVADIRASAAHAVLVSRADARASALNRLGDELDLLERELRARGIDVTIDRPPMSDVAEDAAHADAIASTIASGWAAAMLRAILRWADEPTGTDRLVVTLRQAGGAQDFRVRRAAATEVSRAFNDEADEGIGYVAAQHKSASWIAAWVKHWNALLDRKTCPTCRAHDGEIALPFARFPDGDEPGDVHPNCRCFVSTIFVPMRLRAGETAPGHYVPGDDADDEAA